MLEIKKKLFGYDPVQVEAMIADLNEKIFSLRQELFDTEKKTHVEVPPAANNTVSIAKFNAAMEDLKKHKMIIRDQEKEIEALQSAKEIETAAGGLNYQMIEKIYARAFESSKLITGDAKDSMVEMTDGVFEDLSGALTQVETMYSSISAYKASIHTLIDEALQKFDSLKTDLDSFGDNSSKISEFNTLLQEAKNNIMMKIGENSENFEEEIAQMAAAKPANLSNEAPVQKNEPAESIRKEPEVIPEEEQFQEPVTANTEKALNRIESNPVKIMHIKEVREVQEEEKASGQSNGESILMHADLDNHYSLDSLKVDSNKNMGDRNTNRNAPSKAFGDEMASFDEEIASSANESLLKMQENIKKQFEDQHEQEIKEDEEVQEAVNQTKVKPKISIEHILKKYSNLSEQ